MSRNHSMRDRQQPGLKAQVLFGILNKVTGHGKELEAVPYRPRPSISSPSHGRKMSSYQPPPPISPSLPRRKRRLTPDSGRHSTTETMKYDSQLQSLMLQCLPEETLMIIYAHVVGNNLLHIVRRKDKIGHTQCLSGGDPDGCAENKCRGFKSPNGHFVKMNERYVDLIPLLQSCRKIYMVAVKLLYSSNALEFDSMESIISLSCTVLPQRFDAIQSISLDFRFSTSSYFLESTPSNDNARWVRTWQVIGSIKALRSLRLRISWPYTKFNATQEKRIMQPLWMVHRLDLYEVSLPPAWAMQEVDWSDAPFKVTRRSK